MAERVALVVFPHAGGSVAAYRDFSRRLQADFDVHGVELPGHGRLRQQPFLDTMHAIADFAYEETRAVVARQPTAFLGHSMGAWIAFMVAERARDQPPRHLFASAARPPHLGIHRNLLRLENDELVEELSRLGGVPGELLADREALELFMPALRADLRALEPFKPPLARPLDVPITVLRAAGDEITVEDASAWSAATTGACRLHTLPGGHFFLTEQPDLVSAVLRRAMGHS
jgi:surfactin synthase thioesterase subunit